MNEVHNRDYLHERTLRSKSADNWELYKAREAERDFVEEATDQCTNRHFLPSKPNSSSCSQLQTESGTITSWNL